MKNSFSKNLRIFRLQKGVKQEELAKALNTTQRRISYFETEKVEPDIDTLWNLAEYFGVSVDELIGKE